MVSFPSSIVVVGSVEDLATVTETDATVGVPSELSEVVLLDSVVRSIVLEGLLVCSLPVDKVVMSISVIGGVVAVSVVTLVSEV